jgi:hypothetical protein
VRTITSTAHRPDDRLIDQVEELRRRRAGGFVLVRPDRQHGERPVDPPRALHL